MDSQGINMASFRRVAPRTPPRDGSRTMDQRPLLNEDDDDAHDHKVHENGDAAAQLLRRIGATPGTRIKITAEDDARVLRRIDMVVMPLMLAVYFLQGLDKATIAYSSIFGLIEDTNLKGDQFSWLGSIVYVAQLIAQFPLAWLLVKLPIGRFTGCMVCFWGLTLTLMAAAHTFRSLLVARFFLGAFEASIAPSFVAITSMFWRRREQPMRMAMWYAMNGFTNCFGSLITWGLASIPTPLKPYQVIFVVFGLVTVAFSVVIFRHMPDSPVEANFLTDEDKLIAIERLRMNQTGVMSREWRWNHVWESIRDPKTWFWFSLVFCISVPSGGIASFGPLLVKSFGFDSFQAILFNAPFGLVQLVATLGSAHLAMKYSARGAVIALLSLAPILGCIVMMSTPRAPEYRSKLLFGYYLISVYPGMIPLMYSWSAANTAGDTKKKCTSAIIFVGQSVGNILGPLLYKPSEAPEYFRGLQSNLLLYCAIIALVGLTSAYLVWLNKSHSRRRARLGKAAAAIDYSVLSSEDAERMRRSQRVDAAGDDAPEDDHQEGDRAFQDMTDLQNEDFIFVF
ncbi:major facilitator superfamily domain-containing protein [Plectosphaerella cucumerina]|uniref:Major facilitator superfamily domain-containing protein n=1 Tax=Plectosphaerella cucumerina TaxID=40658 RepID=A0A8K0X2Q4_9PEZI|nr:major facilitator superfamily domain-containing protein [Plectosphaerella cucumerina]